MRHMKLNFGTEVSENRNQEVRGPALRRISNELGAPVESRAQWEKYTFENRSTGI